MTYYRHHILLCFEIATTYTSDKAYKVEKQNSTLKFAWKNISILVKFRWREILVCRNFFVKRGREVNFVIMLLFMHLGAFLSGGILTQTRVMYVAAAVCNCAKVFIRPK